MNKQQDISCMIERCGKRFEMISRDVNTDIPYFAYEIKAILFDCDTGQTIAEGVGACNSKEAEYQNRSPFDAANIVLKKAKERAFDDAAITVMGNDAVMHPNAESQGTKKASKPTQQKPQNKQAASSKQLDFIYSLMSQKKLNVAQVRRDLQNRYQVNDIKELDRDQASDFIRILKENAA